MTRRSLCSASLPLCLLLLPFALDRAAPSSFAAQSPAPSALAAIAGEELVPALPRATDVGAPSPAQELQISVSLPYARPEEMQAFVDSVSDPKSPEYGKYITPEEVGARFGLPLADLERVTSYLAQNGFEITLVASSRLAILATCTVAQAESAFHTTLREYTLVPQDGVEPARFFANARPIELPSELAALVIHVGGLDSYTRPKHLVTLLTPALTRGLYNEIALFSGGFQGTGRTVGISNFDGFRQADWLSYISHFALPVPGGGAGSNIAVVAVNGGGMGAGSAGGEGDLDIQMALGMAPLASIKIYDSPVSQDLIAVLTKETNDNLCDTISESYGWSISTTTKNAAHNQHLAMNAQGITYMAASGDNGTSIGSFNYPDCEPEVLLVGGTVANVNGTTGARTSEVGWNGSGGGWSTTSWSGNVRPSWQVGTGVPPIGANNNHRLIPDIAFHSAGSGTGAYQFYTGGALSSGFVGTSFATPVFAGMLAVIEQRRVNLGGSARFGRIQDLIYAQNGRSDVWFDITSGSNGNLPSSGGVSSCTVGWDTVTGWGPLDCNAFVNVVVCGNAAGCNVTGTAYCAGDAIDPLVSTLCPCLNSGAVGHGCANSINAAGAQLAGSGSPAANTVVLTSSGELTTALSIFLQGNGNTPAGVVFGDGIRCASGTLLRLYSHNAVSGSVSAPSGADASIKTRSAALGDTLTTGVTRYYAVYYRDPSVAFCPTATFNVSNGFRVTW